LPPNTMASNQYNEQVSSQAFMTQYPGMTALGSQALSHSLGARQCPIHLEVRVCPIRLEARACPNTRPSPSPTCPRLEWRALSGCPRWARASSFRRGPRAPSQTPGPPPRHPPANHRQLLDKTSWLRSLSRTSRVAARGRSSATSRSSGSSTANSQVGQRAE